MKRSVLRVVVMLVATFLILEPEAAAAPRSSCDYLFSVPCLWPCQQAQEYSLHTYYCCASSTTLPNCYTAVLYVCDCSTVTP